MDYPSAQQESEYSAPQQDNSFAIPPSNSLGMRDEASIIEKLDPKKVIRDIELTLKGLREDEFGNVEQVREPLMNEKGINSLMLDVAANLNIVFSKIDEQFVGNEVVLIGDIVVNKLMMCWEEYGCKESELSSIVNLICLNSYCALNRAVDGFAMGKIGRITQEQFMHFGNQEDMKNKKGWLNFMKR